MARTFIRQDVQIGSTLDTIDGFDDTLTVDATLESGATDIRYDLNALRAKLAHHLDLQAGNWYDPLAAPTVFPTEGAARGLQGVGDGLHAVERKRVLRDVKTTTQVTVPASQNFVVLALAELPTNTTAAVGSVTTLGTVVAAHTGTFGTHSLDEVPCTCAVNPRNLLEVVDGATRDPITSAGRRIYGLLQTENATDGHTMTGTTPDRAQISFVRLNATGDDLEAVPVADIENLTVNYSSRERVGLEDLNETDFLKGAVTDIPAGVTVDLQSAYNGQGATPVDSTTNSFLDLEGPGLSWNIRDDLEALLFSVTEGSAGGTSEVSFSADVDVFDNNAVLNDFANGATINSGGTRPIAVGVTDGVIESTAGDLQVNGTGELILNDGNLTAEATWAGPGVKLSDTLAEVTAYETAFGGEVSLFDALVQAKNSSSRTRIDSVITGSNPVANTDINGPSTPHGNATVDLLPFDVAGLPSLEVFLNGELMRTPDDYIAGGTPADGDLQFTFRLKGTGSKPDQITVIRNGSN